MEFVKGYLNMFPIWAAVPGIPAIPAETCPDSAGMTPKQIKATLIEQAGSINNVAAEIGENRTQVSAAIHYKFKYQRIRQKLTDRYGVIWDNAIVLGLTQRRQLKHAAA